MKPHKNNAGAAWIPASDSLPKHTKWVLIVWHNQETGSGPHVGLGWRKMDYENHFSGWWETNLGLVHEKLITHWMPAPELPPTAKPETP